jgi:hypothetical protein
MSCLFVRSQASCLLVRDDVLDIRGEILERVESDNMDPIPAEFADVTSVLT